MSRNTAKVRFGLCLECGCSIDEDCKSKTWCKSCCQAIRDSHTERLSEN